MTHPITRSLNKLLRAAVITTITTLLMGTFLSPIADSRAAQNSELVRHTVEKDDTLWALSEAYLESPWRWSEIWEQNEAIENPNLIYPGDVLLISPMAIRVIRSQKLSTEKLEPKIRRSESQYKSAITTIDPDAIIPFLTESIVVEPGELDNAAYVLQGIEDKIVLGKDSRIYARGITDPEITQYKIYRIGSPITDPDSHELYGIEGVYLGNATLYGSEGEYSVLEITRANQGVRPGDRLLPQKKPHVIPHFFPRKPDTQIDTRIVKIPKGVDEAGRRDIVLISGGAANGLKDGHVLQVFSEKFVRPDPVTGEAMNLPDLKVGTLIVFQTYEKVSYAILMETTAPVKVGDRASTP